MKLGIFGAIASPECLGRTDRLLRAWDRRQRGLSELQHESSMPKRYAGLFYELPEMWDTYET